MCSVTSLHSHRIVVTAGPCNLNLNPKEGIHGVTLQSSASYQLVCNVKSQNIMAQSNDQELFLQYSQADKCKTMIKVS